MTRVDATGWRHASYATFFVSTILFLVGVVQLRLFFGGPPIAVGVALVGVVGGALGMALSLILSDLVRRWKVHGVGGVR